MVLLDAREARPIVKVDTLVLEPPRRILSRTQLHNDSNPEFTPVAYGGRIVATCACREQVAAVDFLSRYGRPDIAAENELYRTATQSARSRIRPDWRKCWRVVGRPRLLGALMEATWANVRVEGRRARLPIRNRRPFYFESRMRPMARVLMATLAVDPRTRSSDR
jgi:hypothetical protein